jgi:hypothetical protein
LVAVQRLQVVGVSPAFSRRATTIICSFTSVATTEYLLVAVTLLVVISEFIPETHATLGYALLFPEGKGPPIGIGQRDAAAVWQDGQAVCGWGEHPCSGLSSPRAEKHCQRRREVAGAMREHFERYLAAVPHAEPVETDRLPE